MSELKAQSTMQKRVYLLTLDEIMIYDKFEINGRTISIYLKKNPACSSEVELKQNCYHLNLTDDEINILSIRISRPHWLRIIVTYLETDPLQDQYYEVPLLEFLSSRSK